MCSRLYREASCSSGTQVPNPRQARMYWQAAVSSPGISKKDAVYKMRSRLAGEALGHRHRQASSVTSVQLHASEMWLWWRSWCSSYHRCIG